MSKKNRSAANRTRGLPAASNEETSQALELIRELKALSIAQKQDLSTPGADGSTDEDRKAREFNLTVNPVRRRQGADEDPIQYFEQYYSQGMLIEPIWLPSTLYQIIEESDILQSALAALVDNIVRPVDFDFGNPDQGLMTSEGAIAENKQMAGFFSQCNEKESYLTVQKKTYFDRVGIGQGYREILRDQATGDPDFMYNIPAGYMRISALDEQPILTWVKMPRNGEFRFVPVYARFRRFARWLPTGTLLWFKQLGDPRILNCKTGQYVTDNAGLFITEWEYDVKAGVKTFTPKDEPDKATEIWWTRRAFGGQSYGVPEWVAAMPEVRGRYLAGWCNYDTLDHGGIPPWLLFIYGRLAEGTRKYLKRLIENWRNPNVYSDPGILEIEPNLLSFNSQGGAKAGAEFVSLRDMRNEEGMFDSYRRSARESVGMVLRVPPVLYGIQEGAGGTNYAAIETAEKQVFLPAAQSMDEETNVQLIQAEFGIYDWKVRTKRPPISGDNYYKAAGMIGRTGGGTLNDLVDLGNELFGTQWAKRDHAFYSKLDAAVAIGLVRQGLVTFDYDKTTNDYVPRMIDPGAGGGQPAGANPFAKQPPDEEEGTDEKAQKDDAAVVSDIVRGAMPMADMVNLFNALKIVQTEVEDYTPKDEITEQDLMI
ncbi:MAG: hypothetical protein WC654_00840 [Patescibacteria group bacterium]